MAEGSSEKSLAKERGSQSLHCSHVATLLSYSYLTGVCVCLCGVGRGV